MTNNTGGMGSLAQKTKRKVDNALKVIETSILDDVSKIKALRPQISDKKSFDKFIDIINAATADNQSILTLGSQIRSLGENVIAIVGEVAGILRKW